MAESAEAASPGRRTSGLLKAMARKALAPLVAAVVHAASAYLGRKAGALAQEKLLPMMRERGGSAQVVDNGAADKAEPSRDSQRQDREKRRTRRREALEQTGST